MTILAGRMKQARRRRLSRLLRRNVRGVIEARRTPPLWRLYGGRRSPSR
jgi:hypothetical protein